MKVITLFESVLSSSNRHCGIVLQTSNMNSRHHALSTFKLGPGTGDDPAVMVKGEDIAVKIKELMQSEEMRLKALNIGEEAKRVAGWLEEILKGLIEE